MRIVVAGFLLGGIVAVACAPPTPNKDLVVQEDGMNGANGSGSRGNTTELGSVTEDNGDQAGSTDDIRPDGGTAATQDSGTAATPDAAPKCGWFCPSTTKAMNCNSDADGNTSQSTVTYSSENGTIKIVSIKTLVTNKNHKNLNGAKVSAKANANDNLFVLEIDTGNTLPDNKAVMLQVPGDFTFPTGGQLRIDTNFDDPSGDPVGRCELQF